MGRARESERRWEESGAEFQNSNVSRHVIEYINTFCIKSVKRTCPMLTAALLWEMTGCAAVE